MMHVRKCVAVSKHPQVEFMPLMENEVIGISGIGDEEGVRVLDQYNNRLAPALG
jgi:hypothetical protein